MDSGASLYQVSPPGEQVFSGGHLPPLHALNPAVAVPGRAGASRAGGVWLIDAARWRVLRFQPTGRGAHGLYPSRDSQVLFVSNRGEGSVTLISFRTRLPFRKWRLPGGGSPDMGGVSADGRVLWLTGRYDAELYAISTRTGRLLHRVRVGPGPHGACVWPQPGRYSIGHTGILR
jgi:DNA-binding beta-propeller fold protein YncE